MQDAVDHEIAQMLVGGALWEKFAVFGERVLTGVNVDTIQIEAVQNEAVQIEAVQIEAVQIEAVRTGQVCGVSFVTRSTRSADRAGDVSLRQ